MVTYASDIIMPIDGCVCMWKGHHLFSGNLRRERIILVCTTVSVFCPWQFLSHGYGIQKKGMDINRNYFTNEENMIKSYTTTLDKVSKQQEPLEKLVKLRIEWYVLRQSQPLVRTLV